MESPDSPSPDRRSCSPHQEQNESAMATMVAHNHPQNMPGPMGINKRYRPAPAKTFQCRGYGECRMVFSRSEHLARHIRKHTGERPFTCHCGKQFSRLDNLRQHAQTVHADKQDENERMMRDLTSLHATMAAANKGGSARGGRRPTGPNTSLGLSNSNSNGQIIKQEELSMPLHQRPGTTAGYEGDHNALIYHQGQHSWHIPTSDIDRPDSRPTNNHSFRDPGQSFLAPPASIQSTAAAAQSHSFLPFSATFSFSLPDPTREARPGSSSSRPLTSSGSADPSSRSLPPLSSVVSASIPPSSQLQSFASPPSALQQQQQSPQHVLPFPGSLALRRPSTATRPGTAPAAASFFSAKSSYHGGSGLAYRPELSIHSYGRSSATTELGATAHIYDAELPASPAGYESPFSFHPPAISECSPSVINPRKRPFAGPDGPYDDSREFHSGLDYDYGSESRPQSRRLSVMELCNEPNTGSGVGQFLLSSTGESRPTTSSGLVSSASALALVDRPSPVAASAGGSPLLARAAPSSAVAAKAGGIGFAEDFGGGGISAASRRSVSSSSPSAATATAASAIFPYRGSGPVFPHSPTFSTSSSANAYSPRSAGSSSPFSPRSPISDASAPTVSRQRHGGEGQHDQVRIPVSPHAATALGLRV